jgi:hypothetical protein
MRVCIVGASGKLGQYMVQHALDRPAGSPRVRVGHRPGGARPRASGSAPRLLVRWHIRLDGQDVYSWKIKALVKIAGPLARLVRFADLDDQVLGPQATACPSSWP